MGSSIHQYVGAVHSVGDLVVVCMYRRVLEVGIWR